MKVPAADLDILLITDGTPAGTIDLLTDAAIRVTSWYPNALPPREEWTGSPFVGERTPVNSLYTNIVDTFNCVIDGGCHDELIASTRLIRQSFDLSRLYWKPTSKGGRLYYIIARSSGETNTRYAAIMSGNMPRDDDILNPPFNNLTKPLMADIGIVIEHGAWLDAPPGQGSCVQIDGLQNWIDAACSGSTAIAAYSTTADDDEAYAIRAGGNVNYPLFVVGDTTVAVGAYSDGLTELDIYDTKIRFRNVQIPQGKRICSASIELTAAGTEASSHTYDIYAEKRINPDSFSSLEDFYSRAATYQTVSWARAGVTIGNTYTSPDIAQIIQEIISMPDWEAGMDIVIIINGRSNLAACNPHYYATEGHVTYDRPKLNAVWDDIVQTGYPATCLDAVHIINKFNIAQLTHIFTYDASAAAYSSNLLTSALPYNLLPAPAGAGHGDIVYFGIQSSVPHSGPFNNIIFNLSQVEIHASIPLGVAPGAIWEYWNGAWASLSVNDNTGYLEAFEKLGVNGVYWSPPTNWTTTAINGITAYWVRCRLNISPGTSTQQPIQATIHPYTCVQPGFNIPSGNILGDIHAQIKIVLQNRNEKATTVLNAPTSRVILASRDTSRGLDFTPFINAADEQNPYGVFIQATAISTFVNSLTAPSGRALRENPGATGTHSSYSTVGTITFDRQIAKQYYGRYRIFARVYQNGGATGNFTMRIAVKTGSGSIIFFSDGKIPTAARDWMLLDFGHIELGDRLSDTETADELVIYLQTISTSATPDLNIYDIILMPTDEWIGEYYNSYLVSSGNINVDKKLVIDGFGYPKRTNRAFGQTMFPAENPFSQWKTVTAQPPILPPRINSKIFALCERYYSGAWTSPPWISHSVMLEAQQRYFSMRGSS